MTKDKKFILVKAMTNIISGLSMVTIISLGIMYMSFDNAFVFTDTKISVVNNPIEQDQDIEFYMQQHSRIWRSTRNRWLTYT